MSIFSRKLGLLNLEISLDILEEIVSIEFRKLFLSSSEMIFPLTNDSINSIAINPHLANPAKGKVPNFLQFSHNIFYQNNIILTVQLFFV